MNIGFSAFAFCIGFTVTQTTVCIPVKPIKMGSSGLEPPTSRLSGARSNLLSYEPAARCRLRTRTYFSLVGELSPGPPLLACLGFHQYWLLFRFFGILACALFPSLLVLVRSRRSVFRFTCVMEMMGFEPMTPCLQGRCSPN